LTGLWRASIVKVVKLSDLPLIACIGLLSFLLSCATTEKRPAPSPGHPKPYRIGKHWYQPVKHAHGFRERGMASWYGKKFHGRKTASGEIYNMHALTAAHRTLPLGTHVRTHNLNNNKMVDVRINDRGPFVRGRVIDLSYEAAKRIGLIGPGTAQVEIVALGSVEEREVNGKVQLSLVPGDYSVGDFTVQVGAFKDKENAVRLRNKLAPAYEDAHIVLYESPEGSTFYRVRVGRCEKLDKAREHEKMLEAVGYSDAMVVAR